MKVVNFSGLKKCLRKNLWQTIQQLSQQFRVNQSGEPTNTLHNNTIIQCSFKLISFELVLTLQLICFPFLLKDVYVTLNTSQTAQTHQMKISHGKQIVSTPRPQTDS